MFYRSKNSKYNAKKVIYDGITFDSRKEMRRYGELTMLERAGKITDLRMQVKYVLIPVQREPDIIGPKGGRKPGKLLEKECAYYADFVYHDLSNGETIVEDTKGMRTPEYIIKRKLMLWVHGIRVREV